MAIVQRVKTALEGSRPSGGGLGGDQSEESSLEEMASNHSVVDQWEVDTEPSFNSTFR